MSICPFYLFFCRKRENKCIGYWEGREDEMMVQILRPLMEVLEKHELTEEGEKALDALRAWNGKEVNDEDS